MEKIQKKVGEPETQDFNKECYSGYFERKECFAIMRNEKTEGKVMLAIGNILLPTSYKSVKDAKAAIDKKDWSLMIDFVGSIFQIIKKFEEGKQ